MTPIGLKMPVAWSHHTGLFKLTASLPTNVPFCFQDKGRKEGLDPFRKIELSSFSLQDQNMLSR